jgi:hypothetical protein
MVAPFGVDVPQEAVDDLRERLERARWPVDGYAGVDGDGGGLDPGVHARAGGLLAEPVQLAGQ